ncbi:glycoside hydrolase family 127 protein [Parabacteroides sp. Marseille-P3160]|uniref:glycoside hydrolase family 127 protein n=1 Tax=Parabacteroides sp. Marseille-P3160 TaxID=1917887 RepID=UPI0009BA9A52|nr:beta-L-arabinofuranosidase domain-containing protein [Parabacteroides sp. Marseille-P3160]
MKKYVFFFLLIVSFFPKCIYSQNAIIQQPLLKVLDPSVIQIGGHLGERIDACIEHRVKEQDVHHLIEPFYNKTETHLWQSEFWGKWMLGAVLSYRYKNDPVLMDSIKVGIRGLLESQLPNGYIGNYAVDAQLKSWDIWGRKYSMLGLLSYYDLTGDKDVLKACCRMADHLFTQVGEGKVDIVTTGNYWGMASSSILEPMVFLYQRTGETKYLDFAKYIVKQWETEKGPKLISKAEAGVPVAARSPHPASINKPWFGPDNGQKAYEMMSCYEGLVELYKITREPIYLSAVEKTVKNIIENEINIAGSGSAFECWYFGKAFQTMPTYHTMETCVIMTWMKLCQTLLCLTQNPIYADQIETTTYNALLASMRADAGQIAKYSPLEGLRHPGEEQCGMHINCCNANGPRAFALLPEYAVMTGENSIFINLYSNLEVKSISLDQKGKRKVKLIQQTNYPVNGQVLIKLEVDKPESFTLALRIPAWSQKNEVKVNDVPLEIVEAGTYCKINRLWKTGDVITLSLDVRGRVVKQDNHFAILKGPVVLARDTRFADGFIDESAKVDSKDGYIELNQSANYSSDIWMVFTVPLVLGTDLEGEAKKSVLVKFCDFASAGNTWDKNIRYRVWLQETLNVMKNEYKPY